MIKIILSAIALLVLPLNATAQKAEFLSEFATVSEHYAATNPIHLVQQYILTLDSIDAVAFDTGYCHIEKEGHRIHYEFKGAEAFSDSLYTVKLNNSDKYMILAPRGARDSAMSADVFNLGFGSFTKFDRQSDTLGEERWKLAGGQNGVISCDVGFNSRAHLMSSLLCELSPEHPFIAQINSGRQHPHHKVYIQIKYSYTERKSDTLPRISDYVDIGDGQIHVSQQYKGYKLRVLK